MDAASVGGDPAPPQPPVTTLPPAEPMEQAVPLNGPPPSPLNAKPLLPPHLHDGLMALLDRALRTTGPMSVLHNPFVPETLAANLISAGLIYTEVDWTNPDGEIQVYVTHLLDLIYQRPEMVATSGHMDTSHRWFIHWTCVSYKKLRLEKSLLPTPPPSPPATPPPTPTHSASCLLSLHSRTLLSQKRTFPEQSSPCYRLLDLNVQSLSARNRW